MAIAGGYQLSAFIHEHVHRVQEFFLRGFFSGEEMDVVDEQGIAFSERFAESAQLTEAHGRQESIGEILRGGQYGGAVARP